MENQIVDILQEANAAPYLFIGSGFSRRYIGLPDWVDLLKMFAKSPIDFSRIKSSANGNLPETATILAKEFASRWWNEPTFQQSREQFGELMSLESSPLKYEISQYLKNKILVEIEDYKDEIESLRSTNIDGIITTNWDMYLENIFPDYNVYKSQSDLIFSDVQGICEIYKIHGCSSKPDSLVLTKDDYDKFKELNPYLASKIITIFLEHPIVFIGYSLSDENIQNILISILKIVPPDKLDKLGKNLIFLNRSKGEASSIKKGFYSFGSGSVPVTIIETDDYSVAYRAISKIKRKIPVKYLRLFKSELHEIVKSQNPKEKIFVVDEASLEKNSKIQFVVGVGVASEKIADLGYKGVKIIDLYRDLIILDAGYGCEQLIREIPNSIGIGSKWIPIFKYLKNLNIKNINEIKDEKLLKFLPVNNSPERYLPTGFSQHLINSFKDKKSSEIIAGTDAVRAAKIIPFLDRDNINYPDLLKFMIDNFNMFEGNPAQTVFRKLACMYDWHINGSDFSFN